MEYSVKDDPMNFLDKWAFKKPGIFPDSFQTYIYLPINRAARGKIKRDNIGQVIPAQELLIDFLKIGVRAKDEFHRTKAGFLEAENPFDECLELLPVSQETRIDE